MKRTWLSLCLIFLCACSVEQKQSLRQPANQKQGEYQNLRLNKEFTLRAENAQGILVVEEILGLNDLIHVRTDNPTGVKPYAHGDDIVDSKSGWFQDLKILRSGVLAPERIANLNEKKLFVSTSLLSHATEVSQQELELDCLSVNKGCLLKRQSDTVIIYFRGWVPDYRFGSRKSVPAKHWNRSAIDMMLDAKQIGAYRKKALAELELSSSLFTVASPDLSLTEQEVQRLLKAANATQIILASHSGGWKGLQRTLSEDVSTGHWDKVRSIWMLDNFYNTGLASVMQKKLGLQFLKDHCYAFVTNHKNNTQINRFNQHFRKLCPQVLDRGVSHSQGVTLCMPYFEKDEPCTTD